jgi:hypothetical protein
MSNHGYLDCVQSITNGLADDRYPSVTDWTQAFGSLSEGEGEAINSSFHPTIIIVSLVTAFQAFAQSEIESLIFNLETGIFNSISSS